MKRKNIVALFLTLMTSISFASCSISINTPTVNSGGTQNNNNSTQSELPNGQAIVSRNERNIVTPVDKMTETSYDLSASFFYFDESTAYYTYYLGKVERIPLKSSVNSFEYNGSIGGAAPFTVENTIIETDEVSNQISNTLSETISLNYNYTFESKVDILNTGIEISGSASSTKTKAYTAQEISTFSKSNTQTISYMFTDDNLLGFYRYTLFADVDCFYVVKKDYKTNTHTTTIHQRIIGYYYSMDYCPDSSFNSTSDETLTFELSDSEIVNLPIPSKCITKGSSKFIETKTPSYTYEFDNDAFTVDGSYQYDTDHFSLEKFLPFLNSEYTLKFQVKIYMKEKSSGYQEIQLWDKSNTQLAGNNEYCCGKDYYEWNDVSNGGWYVQGNLIKNINLFLKLGAHGKYSDDWVRADTQIIVSVIKN